MQETSYSYQIIIADDCSDDKTLEIVKEYQQKYPDKILLLTSATNQKLYKNVLRAYKTMKTEYFCVLDPDDFWIDKNKIQKALDFLNKHKEYTIYVTDTLIQLPNGNRKSFIRRRKIKDSTFADFLNSKACLGCTLGSVYRNIVFKTDFFEKMEKFSSNTKEQSFRADTFRNIIHLQKGKAHCVPVFDAVYRSTTDGLWQGITEIEKNVLNANIFKDMWLFFDKQYSELLGLSYKIYGRIKIDVIESLISLNDYKANSLLTNILDLNRIYKENSAILKFYPIKKLEILKYRVKRFLNNK